MHLVVTSIFKMSLGTFAKRYGRSVSLAATSMAVVAVAMYPKLPYTIKELILSAGTVTEFYPLPIPSSATEPCRRGSINCIRTTWTPTEPIQPVEAIRLVRDCLSKYPQEGQNGIDKGGWQVMEDSLNEGGSTRIEFQSGIGTLAEKIDHGQPFVDDLLFKVEPDGRVQIRSSSRKGYSDMGVNKNRVLYLASNMPSSWDTPDPDYNN